MGARGRDCPLCHQCAELRSLQNMRYQGPKSEHHLGSARRGWRSELFEYVTPNEINDSGGGVRGVRKVTSEFVLRCSLYVPYTMHVSRRRSDRAPLTAQRRPTGMLFLFRDVSVIFAHCVIAQGRLN